MRKMLSQAQRLSLPPKLTDLYPFTTRQLELGERMSFAEAGNGDAPPLLFVHGSPTWSFLFRNAIEACAGHYRVIAPDHVGFGLSSKPADGGYHTLERHIANLSAFVETMGLETITLVLHDWGGPIGLGFATRNPQKVQRIVLLNSVALPPAKQPKVPWQLRLLRSSAGSLAPRLLMTSALRTLSAKSLSGDVVAGYRFPLEQPNGQVAPLAFARMLSHPDDESARTLNDIASKLNSVTAKIEIVWGKRDPSFRSPLPVYMLRDAFPNAAEPRWMENAGQLVPEDAPVELSDVLLAPFRPKPQAPKPLFNILK